MQHPDFSPLERPECPYHKPGGLKEKWDGILKEGDSGTEKLRQERYRQYREGRLAEELKKNRATAEKLETQGAKEGRDNDGEEDRQLNVVGSCS